MRLMIFAALGALGLFSFSVFAQERFVTPVDEAPKDATFLRFRTKLIEAVKKRDKKFVLGIIDKNIKNSFGGNDGISEFKRQWKFTDSGSELWNELLTVLTHGGTFDKRRRNSFYAPYLFTNFPADIDQFDYQAIFASNVNLREKPSLDAPVVTRLSYNIVRIDHQSSVRSEKDPDEFSWVKIETLGGKQGFVKSEFVRSPIDYRAGFERKNGKWLMVFFLAGD